MVGRGPRFSSIAVDAEGLAPVAFRYGDASSGQQAVSSDGDVFIAYSGGGLRLATRTEGAWSIEVLDPRANVADSVGAGGVSLAGTPVASRQASPAAAGAAFGQLHGIRVAHAVHGGEGMADEVRWERRGSARRDDEAELGTAAMHFFGVFLRDSDRAVRVRIGLDQPIADELGSSW